MAAVAAPRRSVVFVGFMGAGKTKAAMAASQHGLRAVDTDEEIERELGISIAEFFKREGEEAFRAREEQIVVALLESDEPLGIALGGGGVTSAAIREAMTRHVVVWLDVDPDEAWYRVRDGKTERPLASDPDAFRALHDERRPLYAEVADVVVPARRDRVRRALPAIVALSASPTSTRLIWATSASGEYPVVIGRGILGDFEWQAPGRRFLVTDSNVSALHAGSVGEVAATIELEPGETRKTLAEAERVLRELAAAGMRRDDHLVALGGGVVGDLAGFCAAVYQRGVPVVHVPTTLVAQVDSAYGGKTGVDLPEAKNYVGVYHMPAAVLTDPSLLETLPVEEVRAGYAEVLKTALIAGGELWEVVRAGDPGSIPGEDVIATCVRTKLDIVTADERDTGTREVLNLGHTVGHAIEAATGYERYRHGEAVALGMLAALRLSNASALRDEVEGLFERAGLPVSLDSTVLVDDVVDATERDKKRDQAGVGFVLLDEPGSWRTGQSVERAQLIEAVAELAGR